MNQILNIENTEWVNEDNLIKNERNISKIIVVLVIILIIFVLVALTIFFYHLKNDSNKAIVPEIEKIKTEEKIEEEINQEEKIIIVQQESENAEIEIETEFEVEEIIEEEPIMPEPEILTSASGDTYSYIGTLTIDKINLNMEIISKTTDELMRKSACKLWGSDPNMVGNLCIIGHNWLNTKLFSKVPKLEVGDTFEITDLSGRTLQYVIYDKYIVNPEETECLGQETEGRKEVTLITCTNDSKQRYILHARELEN